MRRKSARKRRIESETNPARESYVRAVGYCILCGVRLERPSCHEIPAGSHRERALYNPLTWMPLCEGGFDRTGCHEKMQGLPAGQQALVKFRAIAEALNSCYGRNVVDPDDIRIDGVEYLGS